MTEILSSRKIENTSDYFHLSKSIDLFVDSSNLDNKVFKIAILSSFTVNGIKEILQVKSAKLNIFTKFYTSNYNQYAQEILNPDSGLYSFNPDLIIVFIDLISLLGDQYYLPFNISEKERRIYFDEKISVIFGLIENLINNSNAKIVFHNFQKPTYSPLGISDNKESFGHFESIEIINNSLRDEFKSSSQVFIFDYDTFCSNIGKHNIFDYKMYYLGDLRVCIKHLPALCEEYIPYIASIIGLTKKCIVLDLDNTLWGGVIGEDGIEGIKIGPTPEGRPFIEFQQLLLSLHNRGIILAINSKNNYNDAMHVINNHPNMILREDHFAALRINWEDKATNMRSLAEEINIGLDSMVFIDDDEVNREIVTKFIPEVYIVDLPKDPSLYVQTIKRIKIFDSVSITLEDRKKGKIYVQEKKRRELKKEIFDLNEYLKQLNIKVKIENPTTANIGRITQLTKKTNQFNMTTKRYNEEDIKKYINDDNYKIFAINVEDKFGDSGLTALAIIVFDNEKICSIDTFLLSCRIIGRGVEDFLISSIIRYAKKIGSRLLRAEYIPSKKNELAKDYYKSVGFKKLKNRKNLWEFDLKNDFIYPSYINIIK